MAPSRLRPPSDPSTRLNFPTSRHVFNVTAVAETPRFARNTLRAVASGWRISSIYRTATGSPLTVTAGTDRALNGANPGAQRADLVLLNPYGDTSGRPLSNFLDPQAFAIPALGALGNHGRNSVRGPRNWDFDVALSRVFRFKESQRLEFRAEAYNVTNSFRPGNPVTARNNPNFGRIMTAGSPRIMQFALKYLF
jgi:hypothetical protein